MADAYNMFETLHQLSATGVKKSEQRIDHLIIKSFLAGVLLSFGGLFLFTVGGGSISLSATLGPGIHKAILAAVFPIGLILVILTSADLFTGTVMIMIVSTLHRTTTWIHLLKAWSISFLGNLLGCLFYQFILVYYAGLLSSDPYRSFVVRYTEAKGNTPWHEMFLRGIGGNWLVCLAICMSVSARDLTSKIIGIFLPIWLFVTIGYEHSIANMFTVQMGMILGADLSIGKYLWRVLLPVTLGNIIGGGFFVGVLYWYLYLAKEPVTEPNTDVEVPAKYVYRTVKQRGDSIE